MAHRSYPPSHFLPPAKKPGVLLAMMQTPVLPARTVPLPQDNPRVRVFPSPDGTVLISGITLAGKWVAEYRCLAEDFDDRCVVAMERRVKIKERRLSTADRVALSKLRLVQDT